MTAPRTRAWVSEEGSSTVVQFRTDADPMVWMHTNLGWLPVGNSPAEEDAAEAFAANTAAGYNLVETSQDHAEWLAGW